MANTSSSSKSDDGKSTAAKDTKTTGDQTGTPAEPSNPDTRNEDQAQEQEGGGYLTGEIETTAQARARRRRELENELQNIQAQEAADAVPKQDDPTHVLILAGGVAQVPMVGTGGTHHWHDGLCLPVTAVIPLTD